MTVRNYAVSVTVEVEIDLDSVDAEWDDNLTMVENLGPVVQRQIADNLRIGDVGRIRHVFHPECLDNWDWRTDD